LNFLLLPFNFNLKMSNTLGKLYRLTTYGESHGPEIGGIIDGFPSNFELDLESVQQALDRRRPGQSSLTTDRQESDRVEFLSGIFEGRSTGSPIAFRIPNKDQRSADYSAMKDVYRPSHADYVYEQKYGNRDHRGGGRASARETANWVVAGAIASQYLKNEGVRIGAGVTGVGELILSQTENLDYSKVYENDLRCPDVAAAEAMSLLIQEVKNEGDSLGGRISSKITGLPVGLGEPIFDKLHARLAQALFSINAVKAVEFGSGVEASKMRGSAHNDAFVKRDGKVRTSTNQSGGIQGGISNGEDILIHIHFKPVATIAQKQSTLNQAGEEVELEAKGRHDACVVPRAVPIVEAMIANVLLDFVLEQKARG